MRCPNCGASSESIDCIECGRSVPLSIQIINNAIRFYNEALIKINMKDLSGAIDLCEKSISLDKNNIDARNLLGLLHYKKGAIGEALKHWMVSSNIDTNKTNKAFYYLEDFKSNPKKYNNVNDAVVLYNQAIYYLKTKNDDLAVIRLKKALDTNPTFIDAMNLLAFCYIVQRKYKSANKLIQIVLKIDINNYLAKKYLMELQQTKSKINYDDELVSDYQYNGKSMAEDEDKSFTDEDRMQFSMIASFIVGILISGAVVVIGGLLVSSEEKSELVFMQKTNDSYQERFKDMEEYTVVLQEELANIQSELEVYMQKDLINQNKDRLTHAETLYNLTQYSDSRVIFDRIDFQGFDDASMQRYVELRDKLSSQGA